MDHIYIYGFKKKNNPPMQGLECHAVFGSHSFWLLDGLYPQVGEHQLLSCQGNLQKPHGAAAKTG